MQGRDRDGDKQADRQAGSKVAGPAQDPSPQLSVRKGSCAFTPSVRPLPDKSLSDRSDKPALPRRAFTPRCDVAVKPAATLFCAQRSSSLSAASTRRRRSVAVSTHVAEAAQLRRVASVPLLFWQPRPFCASRRGERAVQQATGPSCPPAGCG